jgi:hypothetical protein
MREAANFLREILGLEGSRAACNSGVLKERATEV